MEKVNYALITGASSGIGFELARIAAQKSINLILVARNGSKLQTMKQEWEKEFSIQVVVFPCDLSKSNAAEEIENMLDQNNLSPDILINNAGFGLFGNFNETDIDKETEMLEVNIVALTQLSKVIYHRMVKKGYGKIMNIASIAGFMPGPLMAVYYASKAYVLSFSQALANEAKGTGVSITVLCPGPTESNFVSNASLESSMLFKSFGKLPLAKEVANYGFESMMKGKTLAIHGTTNRLMIFFSRFIPRKALTSMVRYVQRKEK